MRHGLAQHAALVAFIEASPWVGFGAFAGDHQHMAVAFGLRRFQKAAKRCVGIALAHAVQVEAQLHGETSAFELARRLAIERLAACDSSGPRWKLCGRLCWRCFLFDLALRRWLGAFGGSRRFPLAEWLGALRDARPKFGVGFVVMSALGHVTSITHGPLTLRQQHEKSRLLLGHTGDDARRIACAKEDVPALGPSDR
jgi:hypothetical protein